MTIYKMYAANGDRAGFWVQRRGGQNACALVLSIAGRQHGRLPGVAPLHENAEIAVRWYDVRSGRIMPELAAPIEPDDKNFAFIAQPSWYRPASESAVKPLKK